MSDTADAIRDREEAKRPRPEPVKETKRGRKAVEGNTEGRTPVEEQAEAIEEEVNVEPTEGQ